MLLLSTVHLCLHVFNKADTTVALYFFSFFFTL